MDHPKRRYRVAVASDADHVTRWVPGWPPIPEAVGESASHDDQWSPETLFVANAIDCFILTFRAMARATHLPWKAMRCEGEGVLDRADGAPRVAALALGVRLALPAGGDARKAKRLLERAERACTGSLQLRPTVRSEVEVAAGAPVSAGPATAARAPRNRPVCAASS
jgi:organic hydroperoxide reductase OsmC/OhrA